MKYYLPIIDQLLCSITLQLNILIPFKGKFLKNVFSPCLYFPFISHISSGH